MIKLYRESESPQADAIEAEFRELVLGYDRILVTPQEAQVLLGAADLPIITNNELVVRGEGLGPYLK